MTYSIVAIDPEAGQIGVAVQSHYFGVGAMVPWARPGVGVVATQSVVRAEYGPALLDLLAGGMEPEMALCSLTSKDSGVAVRQVAVLGVDGRGATHTGEGCIPHQGHAVGDGVRAQANLVAGEAVWTSMVETFLSTRGSLAHRLLAAMDAAQEAGGDLRGQQAAALRIVRTESTGDLGADTILDLRVDDHPEPLVELRRLAETSAAMSGLVRMLEEPGLLIGETATSRKAVDAALAELERAQEILGSGNREPSVWQGLLLARFGDSDGARAAFRSVGGASRTTRELLSSLAAAGMWSGPPQELLALVPERESRQ